MDFDEAGGRVAHKGLSVLGVPPASNVGGAGKAGDGDGVLEGQHVDVCQGRKIGCRRWGEGQRHVQGLCDWLSGLMAVLLRSRGGGVLQAAVRKMTGD